MIMQCFIAGINPSPVGYVVDKEAVDGYFRYFIAKQGKEAK